MQKQWMQSEINFLVKNYDSLAQDELFRTIVNHGKRPTLNKARELGLTNQYIPWTLEEINFLQENYSSATQSYLTTNLQNRKWKSITKKASILGLERISILRKSNLSILLEETPTTYYWIGFLMADGGFTDRRLQLGVAEKDLEHLKLFRKHVNSSNKIGTIINNNGKVHKRIKITHVKVIQELRSKFKISSRKTYEPCSIQHITNQELLFSLIIGFLDGDGCVTKGYCRSHKISFVGHASWLDNFCFMKSFIHDYFGYQDNTMPPKIRKVKIILPQDKTKTKKTYYLTDFYINRKDIIHSIKDKAVELELPFLKRKLGKI